MTRQPLSSFYNGKLSKCKFYWMSPDQNNYGKYIDQPSSNGIISKIGVARNTIWTEENLRAFNNKYHIDSN